MNSNYYINALFNANDLPKKPDESKATWTGNIFEGYLSGSTNNIIKDGIINIVRYYKDILNEKGQKTGEQIRYSGTLQNAKLYDMTKSLQTAILSCSFDTEFFINTSFGNFIDTINKDIAQMYNNYNINWEFIKSCQKELGDTKIILKNGNDEEEIIIGFNLTNLYNLFCKIVENKYFICCYPYLIKKDNFKYTTAFKYGVFDLNINSSQTVIDINKDMFLIDSLNENNKMFSIIINQDNKNNFSINLGKSYNYNFNILHENGNIKNCFILNSPLTNVNIVPIVKEEYTMDKQLINIETEDKMGVNNLFTKIQIREDGMNPYLNKDFANYLGYSKTVDYNKQTDKLYHVYATVANSSNGNVVKYVDSNQDMITSEKAVNYFDKYGQYIYKYDIYNKTTEEINNIILNLPQTYKCCVFKNDAGRVIGIYILHKYVDGNKKGFQHGGYETVKNNIIYDKNNIPKGTTQIYNNNYSHDYILKNYENINKPYIKTAFNITNLAQSNIIEKLKELNKLILPGNYIETVKDDAGYIIGLYLVDISKNIGLMNSVKEYENTEATINRYINQYENIKGMTQEQIYNYMLKKSPVKIFKNSLNEHIYTFFTPADE